MSADLYAVASRTLTAAKAALDAGPTGSPARFGVVDGEIAWDSCETCGQLAVALRRTYLSEGFPDDATGTGQGNCMSPELAADFVMQLVRCAPTATQMGATIVPPTMTALDAAAQQVMGDAAILLPAVACSLQLMVQDNTIAGYVVRQLMVVGPAGMCVGTELTFAVGVIRP